MTPTVSSTQQGDTSIAPDSLQQQAEHYISTPVQANHFQSAATQRPPGTDVSPATATRTWASRIATAPAPATSTTPTSGAVTNDMPTNLLSQNGVQVLAQQGRGVSPRHATAVLLPGISSAQTADDCTAPALLASQSAVSQDGTPPQAAAEAVPNSSGDATAPIMQMMDPQLDVNSHPLLANDMPLPKAMAPMQDAPAMYPTQDVSLTTASQPSAQHTLQLQQAVFTAEHREKRRTAESSLATVQPQDASPIAGTPPAELAVGRSTGTMATATAQAATRTDAPLTAERLVQQVVSHAQVHLKGSQHEILVRLDPPELGAIHLKVTTEAGGQMVAHLEAATPMVRDLLDARLGELRQSLADAGINVNQCTVSLDMQASQQGRHSGQPGQGHTGQATMAQQPLHDTMPEEPVLHAVTARSQGAVDYFA